MADSPLSIDMLGDFGPVYGPAGGSGLGGVVILHGSEGAMAGWAHRFAVILAVHGFLALPLGYCSGGTFWRAGVIRDVALPRTLEAVAALAAHPRCARAGLFGWSRGGEQAMLVASLAAATDALTCVAAHAPADVVVSSFDPDAEARPGAHIDPASLRAWTWPGHDDRLAPGTPIEIETYPGPVFLSVGTADEVWDHRMTLNLADRLAAAGRPADLLVAQGQGHGFTFDREPELWARLTAFFETHLVG